MQVPSQCQATAPPAPACQQGSSLGASAREWGLARTGPKGWALTVHSTGRCSLAGKRCSGSLQPPGSGRSGKIWQRRDTGIGFITSVEAAMLSPPPTSHGETPTDSRAPVAGRHRVGSPQGCPQWHLRRSRGHTARRTLQRHCASSSGEGKGVEGVRGRPFNQAWQFPFPASGTGASRQVFSPSRHQSRGDRSPSVRCTRTRHSGRGRALHPCGCIQRHSPVGDREGCLVLPVPGCSWSQPACSTQVAHLAG